MPPPNRFVENDEEYAHLDPADFDDGDEFDSAGVEDEGAPE
jgi:hypothetical protein